MAGESTMQANIFRGDYDGNPSGLNDIVDEAFSRFPDNGTQYSASAMRHAFVQGAKLARERKPHD